MNKNNKEQYNNVNNYSEYNQDNYQHQNFNDENYQYDQFGHYNTDYQHNKFNNQQSQENYTGIHQNNYNNFNEEYYREKPKKKKMLVIFISVVIILVLGVGGIFGYNYFIKNKTITVNMSQYEIEFVPFGTDGDGKPEVDIKNIPTVNTDSEDVKKFLQEPTVTYNKNNNLKNGDKVEVIISLSKTSAQAKHLEIKGEYKRTFTIRGLNEKTKEKTIISGNNSSSSGKIKEEPLIDTKKLSKEQVAKWVKACYIENNTELTNDDFIVDVSLGEDNLVYAVLSENPKSSKFNSPKMLDHRYRINAHGELEIGSRLKDEWTIISRVYKYIE
ncbi:hypothetical protein [Gemella bergeri]|nr:hypothetical protein [Gemella bergeri]